MSRSRLVSALLVAALSLAGAALSAEQAPKPGVSAVLELGQQFYYAGDPFLVRVVIGNDGDAEVKNPVKSPLFRSLEVRVPDGKPFEATGKASTDEPARPEKLSARGFYGAVVDIAQLYPQLRDPGIYAIRWVGDGLVSNTIVVRIIPKYDPNKDYRARVETDEGSFVIDFLKDRAPIAVKAFVDMANAGFYDGLSFHEIRPDLFVAGGDPAGDGSGPPPFRYPAELGSTAIVTGAVVVKPTGAAPPSNGSQFMIWLRPERTLTGQVTVLGQVVEGLEVVQRISKLPSNEQTARPFYRPLKEILIRKIAVFEKPVAPAPAG